MPSNYYDRNVYNPSDRVPRTDNMFNDSYESIKKEYLRREQKEQERLNYYTYFNEDSDLKKYLKENINLEFINNSSLTKEVLMESIIQVIETYDSYKKEKEEDSTETVIKESLY